MRQADQTKEAPNQAGPLGANSPEFVQLLVSHQAALYAFIHSLIPGDASVNDVLQETNLTLCEKAGEFQPGSNFRAFAFSIARFKVMSHFRDRKRRGWLVADSELCEQLLGTFAEDPAASAEAQDRLRRCLLKLAPSQRELIRDRYEKGQTVRDISRRLKRKEGAMQQLFFRIRKALRSCIEQFESTEANL